MEEEQNVQTPEVAQTPEGAQTAEGGQAAGKPAVEKKGFNITSMILGIIGLVFIWNPYIMLPCSIIAIIFSIAGRKDAGRGMGIAGLVLGIISLAIWIFIFIWAMFVVTTLLV